MGRSGPRLCALYGSVFENLRGDGGGNREGEFVGKLIGCYRPIADIGGERLFWRDEEAGEAKAGGEARVTANPKLLVWAFFGGMILSVLVWTVAYFAH